MGYVIVVLHRVVPEKSTFMKLIFRVFGFLKGYRHLLFLSILLNTIYSLLDAAAIAVIQPVFEVLFGMKTQVLPNATAVTTQTSFLAGVKNSFYDLLRDITFTSSPYDTLFRLAMMIFTIFFLKNILKMTSSLVNTRFTEFVVKSMRDSIFNKLLTLSLDFFNRRKVGDLMSLVTNDISVMHGGISPIMYTLFREPIQIAFFLALLISFSPKLTLVAFSTSIFSLLLIRVSVKFLKRYGHRMHDAVAGYTTVLVEALSGIRIIKSLNAEGTVNKRFTDQTMRYVNAAMKNQFISSLIPSINELTAIAALSVVLYIGGTEVYTGTMKSEELLTFLFALFAIMKPVAAITEMPAQVQRGLVASERVFAVLDLAPTITNGKLDAKTFDRELKINNLTFSYGDRNAVENATIVIPKSKKIALVGGSGSGKSTLADLIIRFYDPQRGEIQLDGVNIKEFTLESYRSLFGVVSQESILFNDTVANNIKLAKPGASLEEVKRAAEIAHASEFIDALPQGYDTYIGDRGVMLSGGQRQRVAIARALLHQPEIVIFDEATSALDSVSEQAVQEAINDVLKHQTAIIIAHRLSTIVDCDCIYVFENGKIVESGTHQQLLENKSAYRRLYDIQFST